MQFSITPAHFEYESAIGYLLRLLKENGVLCASRVINKPMLNDVIKGKPSKNVVLDNLLPEARKLSLLKIKCWTHSQLLTPQVCIECIKQQGYFRAQWQNPFLRHCIIHECALASECSHCNEPLTFSIDLLNGYCTSPRCVKSLTSQPCNEMLKEPERVHDAYLVAKVIFDDISARTNYPPKEITYTLLEKAVDILNNPDCAKKFLDERARNIPIDLPLNIEFNQIEIVIQNLLCDWASLTTLCDMYCHDYVRANEPTSQLWYTAQIAAEIIGIPFNQITILHELGLVKSLSTKTILSNTRIEISNIYSMLSQFPNKGGYVPLTEQHSLMTHHNVCLVDVLTAIQNNQLSIVYKPMSNLMHSIGVLPEEFITFCKLQVQLMRDKTMSLAKVAEVAKVARVELLRLINTGKLKPVYIQGSNSKRIHNKDVLKLAKAQNIQLSLDI
ncbi:hypothetical protein ACU8V4_17550 [Pseudoalteromonas mariniglutinosa]